MKPPFGQDIIQPIDTPQIPDPVVGSWEYENALKRDESTRSVKAMPWLPQLPETWATELYDRIEEAERTYVAPNLQYDDYKDGTAEKPDDIAIVRGNGSYLFSAEHATSPVSKKTGEVRYPDRGTGGLAAVLGEDYGTALLLTGRQTSNLPSDVEHPLKPILRQELLDSTGFLAVHGKNPGMFVSPRDEAEIHACIGLGREPSEALREFAKKIVVSAREDLGLYVVLSNDQPAYIQKSHSTEIKRKEDGSPKLSQLAASAPVESSATFSNKVLAQAGRKIPAMQLELTDLLRWTPQDGENKKDAVSRVIGVAMGYVLLKQVVDLTPTYETDVK